MKVWSNGEFLDEATAGVSVRDTGLLHAAGVFTTFAARGGKPVRLQDHLKRIRESCETLFIPLQYKDELLENATRQLLANNELSDARLRLTVTRGYSSTDPLHGLRLEPTVLLTATAFEAYPKEYYEKGMTVIVLDEVKLNPYDIQAGHKTLNYFSRLAALREANQRNAGEALWFNVHNYLQSGSISNVFVIKDSILKTPPTNAELRDHDIRAQCAYPKSNVLPGITRGAILEIAKQQNIPTRLQSLAINDLLDADEVFLTNSIMGVMPVCRVERKPIGPDKPGQITRKLTEHLEKQA